MKYNIKTKDLTDVEKYDPDINVEGIQSFQHFIIIITHIHMYWYWYWHWY